MSHLPFLAVRTIDELQSGVSAQVEFSVTRQDMLAFAELSGDFNPLHLDDDFARAKGFDGAVVYGGLITAKVSQLIGMKLPGRDSVWSSIKLQFKKPLYIGDAAVVEGVVTSRSEAAGIIELDLKVRARGLLLAKGQAEVLIVVR